jgi:hypothetical protein
VTSRNTENENKRRKIFNKVLNMNWDYVRGKKKQKENKNKQRKRKQTKKIKKKIIRQFGSVFNKKMVKSVIYLLFSYQTGNIDHKPGMSHCLREYRS